MAPSCPITPGAPAWPPRSRSASTRLKDPGRCPWRMNGPAPGLPVTVAWGSRDRILPRRQGIRAKHTIPGARLVRLPGCGHVPMNDDPALVARVILDTSR
ncbi:alpha/beta fold hydrolase [Streptomyces sp. NBC_00012]|uniref:alpha/beta fold hydrolase n=1 Tax=Streptomyces sp. NBC_00012 TaxID=2975621 RepID=UPI003250D680